MRLTALIALLVLSGCVRHIVRNEATYTAEIYASIARQNEAADALIVAAEAARDAGDTAACARYAEPALLIQASAEIQGYRALWLAGLPYPGGDGEDPGAIPDPEPVSSVCGDAVEVPHE
jgi:hypothetical protein